MDFSNQFSFELRNLIRYYETQDLEDENVKNTLLKYKNELGCDIRFYISSKKMEDIDITYIITKDTLNPTVIFNEMKALKGRIIAFFLLRWELSHEGKDRQLLIDTLIVPTLMQCGVTHYHAWAWDAESKMFLK